VSRTGIAVGRFRLGKGLGLRRRQDRVQWWALQTSGSSDAPRQQRRRVMTAIRVVQAPSPSSSSLRRWFEVLTDFARRVESRVGSPVPSGDGSRRRSAASRRCALPFGAGTGAGAAIISTVVSEVLDIFQASQGSLGHFVGRSGLCLHYHLPSAGGYVPATPADRVCVGCRVPPSRRARSWSRAYIITISLRSRLGHSGLGYFRGLGETPQPAETWVWARSARLREYLRAGVRVPGGSCESVLAFHLAPLSFGLLSGLGYLYWIKREASQPRLGWARSGVTWIGVCVSLCALLAFVGAINAPRRIQQRVVVTPTSQQRCSRLFAPARPPREFSNGRVM